MTVQNPELRRHLEREGLAVLSFAPIQADNDWFDASQVLAAGTGTPKVYTLTIVVGGLTRAYCPGYPVVPVIVVTDASGDNFASVVTTLTGVDQFGVGYSETVTATNSSGTWTGTALRACLTLSGAVTVVTCASGDVTASDTQIIGFAKTVGLTRKITATSELIAKTFDGAADAGTLSVPYNTYVVAGTPNSAKLLTLCIRPKVR